QNSAAIYFDANPPIFTNTTLNTVSLINKVNERTPLPALNVFPNPNQGTFKLNIPTVYKGQNTVLRVYNLTGQRIHTQQMTNDLLQTVKLTNLAAGAYWLQLHVDGKAATEGALIVIQ
ncbi:MAG: T9SS type A sorting domain-containing protein, partial [Bacteroidota bacterium]